MDIKNVKLSEIKPYKNNQKKHPADQIKNIATSIKKYGFVQPVVLDANNEIIIGHGRVLAAQQINMDSIPCVYAENLTEEQVRELRIIDNKLNESDWDTDLLSKDLFDLDFSDFDIDFGLNDESDYSPDDFGDDFSLADGDKPEICQMTFTLHQEQKSLIEYAMSLIGDDVAETFGNTNKNGNALYEVVRRWAEQRK